MNCLLPQQAEKLKRAFRTGEITMSGLFKMTSAERVALFEKYVGESAKEITAKIEKAYMKPNQKQALSNVVYKEIVDQKPLYKGVTLDNAKKLANKIEPRNLNRMTREEVKNILKSELDETIAETVTKRFEHLKRSGNLANWEKKVVGTEKLREDKKLMKALAKVDMLDNLGVLNPKQVEDFMGTLVETELGVDLTVEEAEKLSKLSNELRDTYNSIATKDDWTWENGEEVKNYFYKLRELTDFADLLEPNSVVNTANKLVNYARASILATPKSALNSAMYQVIPTVERSITKRIVSGQIIGNKDWTKNQLKMAIDIYNKTGYDISRMEVLGDGGKIFGGEKFKNLPKKPGMFNAWGRLINLGPKWGAGGTDMLIANTSRGSTSWLLAKQQAKKEFKAGKITDVNKRTNELVKDSYSFSPKTEEGQFIRESSILDANTTNNTQGTETVDRLLKVRQIFKIKGIDFGTALIPFAKISLTNTLRGLKIATGAEAVESIMLMKKATKMSDIDKKKAMYKATTGLIASFGIFGAALLLSFGLDDDDYIGTWETIGFKDYNIAKARNAQAGSVRLFGKWVPIRYLPLVNIPLSSIMMARQAKAKGGDYMAGYAQGIFGGIVEAPIISQVYDLSKKAIDMASTNSLQELTPEKKDISNWMVPRLIPAVLSRPLLSSLKDAKYDFMGREVIGGFMFNDDTTNDLILEFNRLGKSNNMPVITNPNKEYTIEELNKLKQNYTEKVIEEMKKSRYKKATDEEKKKLIDKIRTKEILNKLK